MIATSTLSRRVLSSRTSSSPPWRCSSTSQRLSRNTSSSAAKDVATKVESLVPTNKNATASATARTACSKSFAERNPFVFQLGVATAKTSAADIMVQVVVDGKKWDEIDYKRNGIFVFFGFAYLGGFQYWLMVNQFSKWFPTRQRFAQLSLAEKLKDTAGMKDAMKMVGFDLFVHLPFLYFPSYYTCKEIVTGTSWNPMDWVKDGCTKYWNNKEEDLTAMYKLWGPIDCIQFSMPIHISMPFRHVVSFFWTAYISFTRGAVSADEMERRKKLENKTQNLVE